LSGGDFKTNVAAAPAPATVPKFDRVAFTMPATAAGDAIQVAGVKNGDTMGGNLRENKQFQDVVVRLRLDKSQAQELHGVITKQGMDYDEILRIGTDMFGKK
ncbi:MAG: hypothetical protein WCA53_23025, partial [Caballeronia sp.]